MASTVFQRFYFGTDFASLGANPINYATLQLAIQAATVATPIAEFLPFTGGVQVIWPNFPGASQMTAADAAVTAHTGAPTTSNPFVFNAAGPITTTAGPTTVIDQTTPALDAGTYQVNFNSQHRMTAVVAGETSRAIRILTRSPSTVDTQNDHNPTADVAAFNGAATVVITAGQTIRVQLQIQEVGPGVGTAEMTSARFTIDKI